MAFIILFIGGTISFVIYTTTLSHGLVSETYYADEIAYQDQIDRMTRVAELPEKVIVEFDRSKGIIIIFPSIFTAGSVDGRVTLFRPADKRLDRNYPIDLDNDRSQIIPLTDIPLSGLWLIKILWDAEAVDYYMEKEIII